ncbi:hypothetical protein GCM10010213_27730 [Microbacterium maritypicum]|uniref:Uncharacterized protein n=1 Tax=Microbacterium maritypicum TaxID=33918 RepID=A0A4Y4B979_MICMQ|nr:hypothetical protein MLI01_18550 [Microbacterium liquefaciens]GGV63071.1 hypothetical protein GCM10010213_27730 [Microbacterium liquefaciens]
MEFDRGMGPILTEAADADAAEEVGDPQAHADRETAGSDAHHASVEERAESDKDVWRVVTVVIVRIE